MKRLISVFLLMGGLLVSGSASATTYIDTIAAWDGMSAIFFFGYAATSTYGQVITIDAGAGPITQFTFETLVCAGSGNYKAYIYEWNGTAASGAALFTSSEQTLANGATTASVSVPSLSLAPGQYVLFFSTNGVSSPADNCVFGYLNSSSAYSGGFFVQTTAPPTSAGWSVWPGDLAFSVITADSAPSAVPTLSKWSQMLLGLFVMTLLGWHFNRRQSF